MLERDLGRNLVGAVGAGRNEPSLSRTCSEAVALGFEQVAAGSGDQLERIADARS